MLYSFKAQGDKDSEVTPSTDVNQMMKTLYDACDDATVEAQGESGEAMITALVEYVNTANKHDITPMLEKLAKENNCTINTLTLTQIKKHLAGVLGKIYILDASRNNEDAAKLTVTADELAVKNLYYVVGTKRNVIFTTGIGGAIVNGIPKSPTTSGDDDVSIKYEITTDDNSITTLPGVDISEYTEDGIYASTASEKPTHKFIGWVTAPGVIGDYSKEAAEKGGKYANLTIYNTPENIKTLTDEGYKPANGEFKDLAENLREMPENGAVYYAVWEPIRSDYVVQVWFEDADNENTYVRSHTMDIVRTADIGATVKHNNFDVERADETRVVNAANKTGSDTFPVTFKDEDSRYDVADTYTSYENSYVYSPFYGFDFLECDCDESCGCATGDMDKCTCEVCKNMTLHYDENEEKTTGNTCNCQSVTVRDDGETVLNVFYTREQWKIVYHPTVELYAYKDYPLVTDTGTGKESLSKQETIVGRFTDDLTADMSMETIGPVFLYPYDAPRIFTYTGKYGMPVSQGYQLDADGNPEGDQIGEGYTGVNYSQWKQIVKDCYEDYPYQDYELYLPKIGEYTNNYFTIFLGETSKRNDLYFTTEPHNYNYYQTPSNVGRLASAQLEFSGVAEITPAIYLEYENKGDDCDDLVTDIPDTVTMQRYTGTWKGERFSRESSYFLDRNGNRHTGYHYEYGTHTMHLYPFYGNVSNIYTIQYYGEALPSDTDGVLTDTKENIRYKKLYEDTVEAPCDILQYDAKIPAGFTAKMWRTSIDGDFTNNDSQFTGSGKVTNVVAQSSLKKPVTIPPRETMANPTMSNYGNYEKNQVYDGNSYNAYLPTWEVWQSGRKVGNIVPDKYWITDWIRLTNDEKADMTTNVTADMKARLQSSVRIGALYPSSNSANRWRYMNNTSLTAMNGFLYPRSIMDNDKNSTKPITATNVIAMTRNQYKITYNTAFVDADGNLLKEDGEVVIKPLQATDAEEIFYEQLLDGTGNANNYYNAYFSYNSETGQFTHLGYQDTDADDAAEGETVIGGSGKWYLDPDGTVEFNEKAMATMPAKDIDVYYRLDNSQFRVVFIDKLNGGKKETVQFNGEDKTFEDVVEIQTVSPNEKVTKPSDPTNDKYYFVGWFLDEEGNVPFNFDQEIIADTVVYALWRPKTPTKYTIQHILVNSDGTEIKVLKKDTEAGAVGDTIDANALSNKDKIDYDVGDYFEPDFYSQTMVLKEKEGENILTFKYHSNKRSYRIQYLDESSGERIADDVVVPTDLTYVTVNYREFEGWELTSEPTVKTTIDENGETVIKFLYKKPHTPPPPSTGDVEPVTLTLTAQKFLDDETPEGKSFSFTLTGPDGYKQTAQSMGSQIMFPEIQFDEVGEYVYTFTEINEGDDRMTYDESVYQIVVTVTKDDAGNLVMDEPVITLNGEPYTGDIKFNNYSIPGSTLTIIAHKYLDDKISEGEGFSFTLTGPDGYEETVQAVDGLIKFNKLQFDKAGEYVYTLTEVDEGADRMLYDESVYEISVTVTEDDEGNLLVEDPIITLNGEPYTGDIKFNNYSVPEPTLTLKARKYLDDKASTGKRFSFTLTGSDGSEQTVQSVDGLIKFKKLKFDAAGEYVYALTEVNEGDDHMTYDESVYEIHVTVTEDEKGNLIVDEPIITLDGEPYTGNIKFNNYSIPETPSEPGEEDPGTPSDPGEEDPVEEDPGTPPAGGENIDNPPTGDNTSIAALIAVPMAALALIVLLVVCVNRKKNKGGNA